jgi:hypothetical protein
MKDGPPSSAGPIVAHLMADERGVVNVKSPATSADPFGRLRLATEDEVQ